VVQRSRCTPADLREELEAGSGRGSALPRDVLREVADGVRSAAEADARQLLLQTPLPPPLWNARLYDRRGRFIAMPDAWFDEVGMAWEIDSKEWHLSPEDHERTLDRRSAMTMENVVVMHTRPSKLHHRAAEVREELLRHYANACLRRRPPVLAVPGASGAFER
jgi:hypothetical protein